MMYSNIMQIIILQRCSSPPLSDVLAEIRSQCVQFASLLLQGIVPVSSLSPKDSLLLNPLITQTTPRGFLLELVTKTHIYPVTFNKVFICNTSCHVN